MVNGVLNIDKPEGITSHDVVQQIRKLTGERQVGHAGTLDPFATGILVVGIGSATRLLEYTHDLPKTYQAVFILGATSDTDDKTGTIVAAGPVSPFAPPDRIGLPAGARRGTPGEPPAAEITEALESFIGTIEQMPPAYSAVKIKGKKLYEIARNAKQDNPILRNMGVKPRKVTVHDITVLNYHYPRLTLEITCSAGTYIRSIARDLGQKLGTGAYVEELRRTVIGPFTIKEALQLNNLTSKSFQTQALPPDCLVHHLPRVAVDDQRAQDFAHGKTISLSKPAAGIVAVYTETSTLLGIATVHEGQLQPKKVLTS